MNILEDSVTIEKEITDETTESPIEITVEGIIIDDSDDANDTFDEMSESDDETADGETVESIKDRIAYKDSTYEIVSKVAYLIGVSKHVFENEHESPKIEIYNELDQDKNARIIRNLCIVRTSIERNFKNINDAIRSSYLIISSFAEYVPQESLDQLNADGINFIKKSSTKLSHHIIEINKLISDRINNCKKFFPLWLNWQYVKDLFIMPNGIKEEGTKIAADIYYSHKSFYPYKMYINWKPGDVGNLLYNDKKFVTLLYEMNGESFTEHSKVSDAGSYIKGNIYEFIENSDKVVVAVDCENSDPYKLCSTLKNLDYQYTQKISSILLFDDVHSASAWRILDNFTNIPVEHLMTERVKQDKSLVDVMLIARACREHYRNNVDSFILVSSDSDYWGLISSLPDARFLVMIEREKCGPDLKNAIINAGIFCCYIDDFYSGNSEDIKVGALFKEIHRYIDQTVKLNINDMFDEALRTTRIKMSPAERNQFMDKYLKTMQMTIAENGDVVLKLKRK